MNAEMTVAISYGDAQAAIRMPVRADGALPYALAEIVTECVSAFVSLWDVVGDFDDLTDEDAATGDDTA